MAAEGIELRTTLPVAHVATIYHDTLAESSKRVEFNDIRGDDSPFRQFEEQPDFSAVGSVMGRVNFLDNWALQIYVFDRDEFRVVQLVVIGSSLLGRLWYGAGNTYSKRAGRQKAEQVLERLRSVDPALQIS